MNISCRKARTDTDYKYIAYLFNPKNNQYLNKKKTTATEIKRSIKNRNHYIIVNNKKDIGWFCIGVDGGSGKFGLIIDYPFQNKGYGLKAMNLIEEKFRQEGCKKIEMEVHEKNIPAISAYTNSGYKIKNKLLVMTKNITLEH